MIHLYQKIISSLIIGLACSFRGFGLTAVTFFYLSTAVEAKGARAIRSTAVLQVYDLYIINSKGKIAFYKPTKDTFDQLVLVEGQKGQVTYKKNGAIRNLHIKVNKGILSGMVPLSGEADGKVFEGVKLNFGSDELEANRVFEFLADNVYIEWAIVSYATSQGNRSHIYTSYRHDLEYFGAAKAFSVANSPTDILFVKHYHSHPRAAWEKEGKYAFPSDADINFRDYLLQKGVEGLELKIRTDRRYIDYGNPSEWNHTSTSNGLWF